MYVVVVVVVGDECKYVQKATTCWVPYISDVFRSLQRVTLESALMLGGGGNYCCCFCNFFFFFVFVVFFF